MNKITEFSDEYRFLSNFWPCQIWYEGLLYPSTEHAYQAAKSLNESDRVIIARLSSPGKAKRIARNINLREDWEEVKFEVMFDVVWEKFKNPELRQKLLDTGDAELIEGNTWGDRIWGVCDGKGENNLGKILMQVRDRIKLLDDPKKALEHLQQEVSKVLGVLESQSLDRNGIINMAHKILSKAL